MDTQESNTPDGCAVVAALFVYADGTYAGEPELQLWDVERDARRYPGPHPVVAHPPCNVWCQLAPLNAARLEHYEVGADDGCFASALASVRAHGGVLEHPAYSLAWPAHGLPRPQRGYWRQSLDDPGWVTEVSQVAYGHPARKRTWLYYCGARPPHDVRWDEPEAVAFVGGGGWRLHRRRELLRGDRRLQRAASSSTPPAFRDELLSLARASSLPERSEAPTEPPASSPAGASPRDTTTSPLATRSRAWRSPAAVTSP